MVSEGFLRSVKVRAKSALFIKVRESKGVSGKHATAREKWHLHIVG